MADIGHIVVLEPVAPLAASEIHLAPRPRSLAGRTLALLSAEGRNGRELIEDLGELLQEREGVRVVRHRSRHGGDEYDAAGGRRTATGPESLASLAPKVDFAITGVGL